MDEATSSVDTLTEALIQRGMETLMSSTTSFVIAHRLSTIKQADRILVIDDGRIAEVGTHAELIRARGHYYDLYTKQFREQQEPGSRSLLRPLHKTIPGAARNRLQLLQQPCWPSSGYGLTCDKVI